MSSIILASDLAQKEIDATLIEATLIEAEHTEAEQESEFNLNVKLLNEHARLPQRSSSGAAGYDIYAAEQCFITPGSKKVISTGISIELPQCPFPGHIYCMKLMSRSGLSVKQSIEVGAGLIDRDYRGEIKVVLRNHSQRQDVPYNVLEVNIGDRIAQGVIIPVAIPTVVEVKELTNSARGTGGFGSTGR
jgi:dUTP pyrophosphatase